METKKENCPYEEVKIILEKELEITPTIKVNFGGNILRVQKSYSRSDLFVLARGKKCYGTYLEDYVRRSNFTFFNVVKPKKEKSINAKWLFQMSSIKSRLEASGLWENLLKEVNIAIEVGLDDLKLASDAYWLDHKDLTMEQSRAKNSELVKAIDPRLIREDGGVNTNIVWPYSHLQKIKKMRFEKYTESNNRKMAEVKTILENKQKGFVSGRVNYDIHFEYNPEINKAFYSEEFKDCGNGHYYLALDATHALFSEDD